jgi:hypothetical protein
MKRTLFLVFIIMIMTSFIYAQDNDAEEVESTKRNKNIVAIDFGYSISALMDGQGFGIGVLYERYLADYFSTAIGTSGLFYKPGLDNGYLVYDVVLHGRFYPTGAFYPSNILLERFYLGCGFGYSFLQMSALGDQAETNLFCVTPEAGYKFVIGSFLLELWFGYSFYYGEINYPLGSAGTSDIPLEPTGTYDLPQFRFGIIGGFSF